MPDLLDSRSRPNSVDTPKIAALHREQQANDPDGWTCHCFCCDWFREREKRRAQHARIVAKQEKRIAALEAFGIVATKGHFYSGAIDINATNIDKIIRLLRKAAKPCP